MPTHSFAINFAVVSHYVLFVELAPPAVNQKFGTYQQASNMARFDFHRVYCTVEIKTKSMIKAQISDVKVCRSERGMP